MGVAEAFMFFGVFLLGCLVGTIAASIPCIYEVPKAKKKKKKGSKSYKMDCRAHTQEPKGNRKFKRGKR